MEEEEESVYTAEMNREAYDLWLTALESGEYPQGKNALCEDGQYCCLGVLAEVALKAGVRMDVHIDTADRRSYDDERNYLPAVVQEWAGIWNRSGRGVGSNPMLGIFAAADWNDKKHKSFAEIAQLIRTFVRPADPVIPGE